MNPNVIETVTVILFIMLFFILRSMTKKTPEAHFSVTEFLIKGLYHIAAFLEALAEASDSFLICFRDISMSKKIRSRAEDVRKIDTETPSMYIR
jgi:hypothetical protein